MTSQSLDVGLRSPAGSFPGKPRRSSVIVSNVAITLPSIFLKASWLGSDLARTNVLGTLTDEPD